MYRFKKILGIVIILGLLGTAGYYVYKSTVGKSSQPEFVAEQSGNNLKLTYGNIGENVTLLDNPATVNYGVKVYPGATASTGKSNSFTGKVNKVNFTTGSFVTNDSVDKVVSYYKQQFGSSAKTGEISSQDGAYKTVTGSDAASPVVVVYRSGDKTTVQIISSPA